jgi:membrane protein required for beta-lactamase induction
MQFIALLMALAFLQYLGTAAALQKDQWFSRWQDICAQRFSAPWLQFALIFILPCGLLALLMSLLGTWAWGMFELLASVVVLLYCFGRGEFSEHLQAYSKAWRNDETENLTALVCRIDNQYVAHDGQSIYQSHVDARENIIYVGFQRLFVVIFWFAIFGPAAALFYRLLLLANNESVLRTQTIKLLEWPAARLMALSFSLVGDFSKALGACSASFFLTTISNKQLVSGVALSALNLNMQWLEDDFIAQYNETVLAAKAVDEIKMIEQLLRRSLAVAVVGIAVFQVL